VAVRPHARSVTQNYLNPTIVADCLANGANLLAGVRLDVVGTLWTEDPPEAHGLNKTHSTLHG